MQHSSRHKNVGTDSLQANAGPLFMQPEAPTPPPKRSHRKRNIIIAIIVAIILIPAAVVAVYWFATPQQAPTHTNTPVVVDSAETIINKINARLSDTSRSDHLESTITQSTPLDDNRLPSPSYKVGDADYAVFTDDTYGLSIAHAGESADIDEGFNNTIAQQITDILTSTDYKKGQVSTLVTNYESTDVICTIMSQGSPMSVACANKSAYTRISEQVAPFAKAHAAKVPQGSANRTYSTPKVTDSETKDYQRAEVSLTEGLGGVMLLFYRHGSDDWQFFKGTQNILACSDYNTVDIVSAFKGEKCMNDQVESTVGAPVQQAAPIGPIAQPAQADTTAEPVTAN